MDVPRSAGFFTCLLMAGAVAAAPAPARTIRLAAEDWPPFITASLAHDGESGNFTGTVLARAGYALQVDYFPWKRTMQLGLRSPRYAGFMAVWRTAEREKLCHFSSPIGNTLTVLAYLKEAPLKAGSLAELKDTRIGTVSGYSNGEQFDAMVRRGELRTDEGVSDIVNLKKLLSRRFSVIVIEKHVLRQLMLGPDFSKADRERVALAENFFSERSVHICFKRNAEGQAQQKMFNAAARTVDMARLERDYWKKIDREGGAGSEAGATPP
ncbi:MAG TPA: amino acid ABC transporter substrate-binding protein [Janthinobacterium sp.]|nr:amino acid ABC transporter substrate-binding protein [Janthinobacterium sp.]